MTDANYQALGSRLGYSAQTATFYDEKHTSKRRGGLGTEYYVGRVTRLFVLLSFGDGADPLIIYYWRRGGLSTKTTLGG
jgi:hypothetical protein